MLKTVAEVISYAKLATMSGGILIATHARSSNPEHTSRTMADIVLALKPKWLDLILSGKKTVECRRIMPKKLVRDDRVYLYCQGDIHGFCTVSDIESIDGNDDWELETTVSTFAEYACLSEDELLAYWQGAKHPGIIIFHKVTRYDDPHPWRGSTPQNFCYMPNKYKQITVHYV